jgi:coiled-coil domain-containing protein 12
MSDDRKVRLAALAARAGRNKVSHDGEHQGHDETLPLSSTTPRTIRFRNYTPSDPSLLSARDDNTNDEIDEKLPAAKRFRPEAEESKQKSASAIERALAKTKAEQESSGSDVNKNTTKQLLSRIDDAFTRKINGDLKRDIQAKLDKLERRTQKAIIELLRMRLENEAEASVTTADDID